MLMALRVEKLEVLFYYETESNLNYMNKNEVLPTCPICSVRMVETERYKQCEYRFGRKRFKCPKCGCGELAPSAKEEAIINGDYDDEIN